MALQPPTIMLIFLFFTFSLIPSAFSVPFVFFHGLNNSCTQMEFFTTLLQNVSGSQGYCIEIGNGEWDSWFTPIMDQVDVACDKGNMISRGVIELCDDAPPVKNYVSLAGPQAGLGDLPNCRGLVKCEIGEWLIKRLGIYNHCLQGIVGPTNFIKFPHEIEAYLKGSAFLPKISNEIKSARNPIYKERFASLENLVLVMNENDSVFIPRETSWFGFFQDGSTDIVLPANETLLYKEDWIGLRSLDEAGKVKYVSVPGEHAAYTCEFIRDVVGPYLNDEGKHVEYDCDKHKGVVMPYLKDEALQQQVAAA